VPLLSRSPSSLVFQFDNTTTATIYFKLLFNFKNNRLQKQNLQ
jgi:hypothetical protein